MKCVCERDCQVRINGKIITFARGDVVDLEEEHRYFRNIEGGDIDFSIAGEEELLEAEYDLNDLKAYIRETYGKNPRNRGKENTVKMLLDCRFREVDADRLKKEAEIRMDE